MGWIRCSSSSRWATRMPPPPPCTPPSAATTRTGCCAPRSAGPSTLTWENQGHEHPGRLPLAPAPAHGEPRHVRHERPDPASRQPGDRAVKGTGLPPCRPHPAAPQPRHAGRPLRHLRVHTRRSRGAGAGDDQEVQGHRLPGCPRQASSPPCPRPSRRPALMAHACEAGHEISEASHKRGGPCSACRIAAVAAQVATADPTLDRDLITQAIEAVVTSPAALRDLHAALAGGPVALIAGAPAVVGRLVIELVARGSRLALPACSICASSARPLIRSGDTGVCPRCRSYQLAAACAGCGQLRRVYGRNAEASPLCWACAKRPERVCGECGRLRPMARRARDGHPDVCNDCYRRPVATCQQCGQRRRCNFVAAGHAICGPCSPRRAVPCAHCGATRPPSIRWAEGPVCEPCYRAALSRRGTCTS